MSPSGQGVVQWERKSQTGSPCIFRQYPRIPRIEFVGVRQKERLHPWVLVRLLPNLQQITVAQYRSRSDADGHLQVIRRLMPNAKFEVMFNPELLPKHQENRC